MLEINEIFGPTIQGEGKLVGNPSIFIRFANCNFKCEGFNVEYETPSGIKKCACDTYYAVDKAFKHSWTQYNNYKDILKEVELLSLTYKYKLDIVITGGEPLLYWNKKEFQNLLKYYVENGHQVTIETNASLKIDFKEAYQKEILFSMSVKLSNSLEALKKRINYETINKILKNTKNSYLKFVLNKNFLEKAQKEINEILLNIEKTDIYLMPMGDNAETLEDNCEEVIKMAIQNGFKYCDRLHIRVWNNKRGV